MVLFMAATLWASGGEFVRLDTLTLLAKGFHGISDIAYDGKKGILYAVGDDGTLHHVALRVRNDRIETFRPFAAYPLRDKKGKPLEGKEAHDAEGLTLTPKGLLVTFERRPRAFYVTPDGHLVDEAKLPKPLRKKKDYRHPNKMLEAVAYHPRYGPIYAPEIPLAGRSRKHHTLYAEHHRFKLRNHAPISALAVTDEGWLLVLERGYDDHEDRWEVWLTLLDPQSCSPKGKGCRTRRVAHLKGGSKKRRWVTNFEGLAALGDGRYLMISDDDGEKGTTVVVLFSLASEKKSAWQALFDWL